MVLVPANLLFLLDFECTGEASDRSKDRIKGSRYESNQDCEVEVVVSDIAACWLSLVASRVVVALIRPVPSATRDEFTNVELWKRLSFRSETPAIHTQGKHTLCTTGMELSGSDNTETPQFNLISFSTVAE